MVSGTISSWIKPNKVDGREGRKERKDEGKNVHLSSSVCLHFVQCKSYLLAPGAHDTQHLSFFIDGLLCQSGD